MPPIRAQTTLDYLCSRARAATFEARSEEHQNGPDEYYVVWLTRMKMELVSPAITLAFTPAYSFVQEALEVLVGSQVVMDKFNYILPFHKQIHQLVNASSNIFDLKQGVLRIDPSCISTDPTRVVDHYADPWWITPSPDSEHFNLLLGVPDFASQVRFHVVL